MYLASEAERQEYVLSQDGLIYRGKPKHITILPWTFGQVLSLCIDQNSFNVPWPVHQSSRIPDKDTLKLL